MEKEISLKAKISKDIIRFFTSQNLIGSQIVDGTFRKKMQKIEPPWLCPLDYMNTKIQMKRFRMEFLLPKENVGRYVILQLHGGGYQCPLRNAYRDFAVKYSQICNNASVLSIDYRVAPENPFPAALEDAYTAYEWLLHLGYSSEQIILVGDSAGGGLALALLHYLKDREEVLPGKYIGMSPWTDLTASGSSYKENYEKDPLFGGTKESMIYSNAYYGKHDPSHPYISPKFGDFEGMPPMLLQVGEDEMLLSDSVDVAEKAKEAGCQVKLTIYPGMYHVFQLGLDHMKESAEAWKEIETFLEE